MEFSSVRGRAKLYALRSSDERVGVDDLRGLVRRVGLGAHDDALSTFLDRMPSRSAALAEARCVHVGEEDGRPIAAAYFDADPDATGDDPTRDKLHSMLAALGFDSTRYHTLFERSFAMCRRPSAAGTTRSSGWGWARQGSRSISTCNPPWRASVRFLVFDGRCQKCRSLAEIIASTAGGRGSAPPTSTGMRRVACSEALSPGWRWQPYLIEADGGRTRAWSRVSGLLRLAWWLKPVRTCVLLLRLKRANLTLLSGSSARESAPRRHPRSVSEPIGPSSIGLQAHAGRSRRHGSCLSCLARRAERVPVSAPVGNGFRPPRVWPDWSVPSMRVGLVDAGGSRVVIVTRRTPHRSEGATVRRTRELRAIHAIASAHHRAKRSQAHNTKPAI